jgi:hypothetical protein
MVPKIPFSFGILLIKNIRVHNNPQWLISPASMINGQQKKIIKFERKDTSFKVEE